MSVIVVGLEQKHAPLDLLDRVSVTEADTAKALGRLRDQPNLSEAVLLSTCLRTEVYAVVERFHDGVAEIQEFLADVSGSLGATPSPEYCTIRFDDDVTDHLFSVASGLDSAVLGESEVLGQVRRAWERAQGEQASGPVLGALFRHAVETGKRVRSETAIARGITSLSHGAVALAADRRPGGLAGTRVVVVGAGEMGEGVAQALAGHGVDRPGHGQPDGRSGSRPWWPDWPAVATGRSRRRDLDDLAGLLGEADVVFTTVGTVAPDRRPGDARGARWRAATGRADLVVVDLGVPRNVEPDGGGARRPGPAGHGRPARRGGRGPRRPPGGGGGGHRRSSPTRSSATGPPRRARDAAPMVSALRSRVESARRAELDRQRSKRSDLDERAVGAGRRGDPGAWWPSCCTSRRWP